MASPDPTLPTPASPRPAPLLGPTTASSVLVGGACLTALADAWASWYRHGVSVDYVAGAPGIRVSDLTSADSTARTVEVLYVLAMAAAAIVLLVWLSRVRTNTRLLGHPARWPWLRPLVLGAWFAVCLIGVATTFLYPGGSIDELSQLATIDSVTAPVQCVVGVTVIVVVRMVTPRRSTREPNQPGRAVRADKPADLGP